MRRHASDKTGGGSAVSRPIRIVVAGLLILGAGISGLQGQSFSVLAYTESDGLLSSQVYDVVQDLTGRMWFATRLGISVYDGVRWTQHTVATGLPLQAVRDLCVDSRGRVWAWGEPSQAGFAYYAENRWTFLGLPASAGPAVVVNRIKCWEEDGQTCAAASTPGRGIYLWRGNRWSFIRAADGLASDVVYDLAVSGDALYAATSKGLSVFRPSGIDNTLNIRYPRLASGVLGIQAAQEKGRPQLWMAGKTWLGVLEDDSFRVLADDLSTNALPPFRVIPDRAGGAFIANLNKVIHWDAVLRQESVLDRDTGLRENGFYALCLDREQILWLAGLRGVNKIASIRFANYRKQHGLLEDEIASIREWRPGTIVFGHNRGITLFSRGKVTPISFPRSKSWSEADSRICDMAVDSSGALWLAASRLGLGRMEPNGRISWLRASEGIRAPVNSVINAGSDRIFCTAGDVLYEVRNGRAQPVPLPASVSSFFRRLVRGPGSTFYILTNGRGLIEIGPASFRLFLDPDSPEGNSVYDLYFDSTGRILVGTLGGLRELRGGKIISIAEGPLRVDRPVYLLLRDPRSGLWIGTDNGVLVWNGTRLISYTPRTGFAGYDVNRAASLLDSDGRVWIGTEQGVSCYRKDFDFGDEAVPAPQAEILRLNVGSLSYALNVPRLDLEADQNSLTFTFAGISFIDESAVRFRCRLSGFDDAWSQEFWSPERRYTTVPPGRYRLALQARNAYGKWSSVVQSPEIRIAPPFWLRWWFLAGCLLTIVLLGYGALSFRDQKRDAARLKQEVEKQTADIRASLQEKDVLLKEIHHRVKNNLQIISSLLYLQSRQTVDTEAQEMIRESRSRVQAMGLVHETLYQSENLALIEISSYLNKLVLYLKKIYEGERERIRVEVDAVGIALPMELAVPCGLLVNELVGNALKHAFPQDRPGQIRVEVEAHEPPAEAPRGAKAAYTLTVRDDGVGLPEPAPLESLPGLGLHLVRALTLQIGGILELLPGEGAAFRISFSG